MGMVEKMKVTVGTRVELGCKQTVDIWVCTGVCKQV